VTIDYTRSLEEMVKAGRYDYANSVITAEHFPTTGEGEVRTELVLVQFHRENDFDQALAEFDKLGLVPARIEHLLALGEKYPELQKQFPIMCLGSVWANTDDRRYIPFLDHLEGDRKVCLSDWSDRWLEHCRFAALRKISA
jgi:hypothetical protein